MEAMRPEDSCSSPRKTCPCVSAAFNSAPSSADFPDPECPKRSTWGTSGVGGSVGMDISVERGRAGEKERGRQRQRKLLCVLSPLSFSPALPLCLASGGEHHVESGDLGRPL